MKTITCMLLPIVLASTFMLPTALSPVRSSYAAEVFGTLAAARAGLEVADDMIGQGKLDPGWAAAFSSLAVTIRNIKGFAEYVGTLERYAGRDIDLSQHERRLQRLKPGQRCCARSKGIRWLVIQLDPVPSAFSKLVIGG